MATNSTPLPDSVLINLNLANDSYFDINISNGGLLTGFYDAWCVDFDTIINMNQTYTANVYSSYEPIPSGLIERPENLDLVNWLLNQGFYGQNSPEGNGYDQLEIQQAIWHLVESDRPTTDTDALNLVNLAIANGEGYIPPAGGKIGIILDPIDSNGNNIGQVIITPIPVPQIPDDPAIDVEKYVSVDGGKTWHDADTITGPYSTENTFDPIFKFVVTNTGNVDLRNITLSDSDYDLNGSEPGTSINIDFLAKGGTYEQYFTAPWEEGQHSNTAIVSTIYTDITNRTYSIGDRDDANYYGASPDIDVEKYVSVDGGKTWYDADNPKGPELLEGINPQFKFVITNTGNVDLNNVTLDDSIFNLDGLSGDLVIGDNAYTVGSLGVGNSVEVLYNGTIWQEGQHTNTATTKGDFTDSNGYTSTPTDSDDANYFGASPDIDLEKLVSVDGGKTWYDADEPAGPMLTEGNGNPMFKFTITNTGNVDLNNVTLNDNIFNLDGLSGDLITGDHQYTLGSLQAGKTVDIFYNGTWEAGQHTNIGTITSSYTDTNGKTVNSSDSDNANYYGDALPEISIIKTATPDQFYEHKGGLVTYNPHSALQKSSVIYYKRERNKLSINT